jgi:uncharacterized protein (TIGR04255 family)
MTEPRRLRTPPITEAIIDLRAEPGVGFDATRLRGAESILSGDYALDGEQHLFVRTVTLLGKSDDSPDHADSTLTGYTFRSPDERFVAQLTVEGLTVSQLKDYTTWEDLAEETAKLWKVYMQVALPKRVLRVGTRYLNRICIPQPTGDLGEYFITLPKIPPGVPQSVTNLLVRMVLHEEDPPFSVSITEFLEATDNESICMILDIDAFSRETYELDEGTTMWKALGGLRDLKNRVFFGSVTDKTLGLFE